ncbi:MAG TPA: DUF6531 domain-containing protein, partial [Solirubrobacterales bacterium]|nr:DUF6531 domain-containing protein [Solirubrobacterales bacterium]
MRWAVSFALLLSVCVSVPIVTASTSPPAGEDSWSSAPDGTPIGISDAQVALAGDSSPGEAPDSIDQAPPAEPEEQPEVESPRAEGEVEAITEASQQEAREKEAHERTLAEPASVAERHASEYAYVDVSPVQAESLLHERFSAQLKAIDSDPSRVLSEVGLVRVDSPTEALITLEGEKALLESDFPVQAPGEDGELHKVDLDLVETETGYAPKNPLVDLALPGNAAEPIAIGDQGLAMSLQGGSAESTAQRFGSGDLFLSEVSEDTGMLLSPITGGLDISNLLLSRRSPEEFVYALTLPEGAELRADGAGGAQVVGAKEQPIATIRAPQAVDAQGSSVPVTLAVKGNALVVEAPHRSMDIAYPVLVDPEIVENWQWWPDASKLNYWTWATAGAGGSPNDYLGQRSPIVTNFGPGLYVRSRSNVTYPGGSFGRWWFTPQGSTTYMRQVVLGPFSYDAHGCTANEPHPYIGVWNDYSGWKVLGNAYPTGWSTWIHTGEGDLGAGTRTAFLGIEAAATANIKCGHDAALGGVFLALSDPENPFVWPPSGYPTGWIKDNSSFTLNVPVYDPGLGVKSTTVSPKDSPPLATKTLGCSGHYDSQCPANHTFQFAVSADSFDQGEKEVRVSATDAMVKSSDTQSFMMKVDRTPPEVTLDNQLAIATGEQGDEEEDLEAGEPEFDALSLSVYNLTIEATDGKNDNAATRRSGVKSIEVFLDNKGAPEKTWTQSACSNSCGMNQTYTLKTNELTALTHHTLRVVVRDHAGNTPREREVEFEYVPATGMKEEYVLHRFPLPNGQGDEDSEENPIRPELAVNVMNGNLVYRQLDVEVPGPAADLEVERYYNSLLPDSQDTEWGDGWTLAQTPTLEADEPGEPGPITDATIVQDSGAVESSIDMPTEVGEEHFDENLQAVVTREATGYEITDESGRGEGTLIFNEAGEATELEAGEYAGVEYGYDGGELSEIAVDDPASAGGTPEEAVEREAIEDITPAFKSATGTQGSADGQFKVATDVAIDPTDGTHWVVDDENDRIQHFTASG